MRCGANTSSTGEMQEQYLMAAGLLIGKASPVPARGYRRRVIEFPREAQALPRWEQSSGALSLALQPHSK